MASLFDRFLGRKEPSSAQIAKERLKLVLVTDRSNLSPDQIRAMQREIIEVIKRYIEIDELQVQISVEQREREHYLVADIPLQRNRSYGALEYPDSPPTAPDSRGRSKSNKPLIDEPPVSSEDTIPHQPPS
ncbi:MAG: cell division topological specificity factor MinE [Anaerolineae bacterium]|nr:cell division topological specificity factor MinE [Anaerolineae bacterium]